MKKIAINSFILIVLFLSSFITETYVLAGTPQQGSTNSTSVTFAQLGYADSIMDGPIDITRKTFSVPSNWSLLPGGLIEINYDVIFSGSEVSILDEADNTYAGLLTVSFNNHIIGDISLNKTGSYTQQFQIPREAITSARGDGQHELSISLTAQFDCIYDIRTFVTVKSTSHFDLPFEISTPNLDLRRLPAPFYLPNSLLPDKTILVISDEPSIEELQAALNVRAGFGSMVERVFDFQMITLSELNDEALASSNLIFVGTPDDFPLLQSVLFPTPVSNGQFIGLPVEAVDDGVVELALSPWNTNKVIMLVSGNSNGAITKAATAVSSGRIFVYQNPTVVYVSDVKKLTEGWPLVEDIKLQDLGFENTTLEGIGEESEQYSFYVSQEQIATEAGEIILTYYHSGLLDYSLSSLTLYLNDEVISSQPFTKESEQLTYLPIKIPPGLLRFGENHLEVTARMEPDLACDTSGFSEPWVTISNQTALHLPAAETTETFQPDLLDLKYYPTMFMTHSDLGDLAFILPENDPISWKIAADLAYSLGESANPIIPNIAAAYADNVPVEIRNNYSLILIGKPSALTLLTEFNDKLPAAFDFNLNIAEEKNMQIVYRLPPDISVGYLELITSPYNAEKIILVASGNNEGGVAMAGSALINEQLKDELTGQFVVTNGAQVAVSSAPLASQFSIVGTLMPDSNQVVTTPLATIQPNTSFTRPIWLLPVLILSGIIALLVIVFVTMRSISGNRSPQLETSDEETPLDSGNKE